MTIWSKVAIVSMAGVLSTMATVASAAEIKVISQTAMREILEELVPMFEKSSGDKITVTFHSGAALPAKVRESMDSDLVVTTPTAIADLTSAGRLIAGSRIDFVRSGAGVAVKQGAPKPDIGTVEAFKNALLAAKSVGISSGPSGVHLQSVLVKLGIADAIQPKTVTPPLGERIGSIVARGEAEIGVQQITELLLMPGIDYVGPLPNELQANIVYALAIPASAPHRDAAQALAKFLTSPAAVPVMKKLGLDPL
jgi:molybdate transport system substrate-binding protein